MTRPRVTRQQFHRFSESSKKSASNRANLRWSVIRRDRHPNLDFFVADLWAWALKDDYASMEHPFFSLSKKRDLTVAD